MCNFPQQGGSNAADTFIFPSICGLTSRHMGCSFLTTQEKESSIMFRRVSIIIVSVTLVLSASAWANKRLLPPAPPPGQPDQPKPQLLEKASRGTNQTRTPMLLTEEVRHQLVMLPYYGVFDWLESEVKPDGTVILRGEVMRPLTKSDAEFRIRQLEAVVKVVNEIEVVPLSITDERLRKATYLALFNWDSALFRYAIQAVPPIHIIIKNGRATIKGVVLTEMDRQLAYLKARGVSGLLEVKNELRLEKPEPEY